MTGPATADDTVYLVSYPRSGNTWLRYLLANLLDPSGRWTIVNIGRVVPDLHEPPHADAVATRPRIVKSHEPYTPAYRKVIYLYRDGRDVAVSLYDFHRKLRGYAGDFGSFLRLMLEGGLPYGTWQAHVEGWLQPRGGTELMPLRYEALCADTAGELSRLAAFLGVEWSPAHVQQAIRASTLERQSRDFRRHKLFSHWLRGFRGGVRGGPGAWQQRFDAGLNEYFLRVAGEIARRLGYAG